MASPDVSAYVDLTLFDRSVQDIVDELKASVQLAFPDWVPLEGHVEMVLLEAFALQIWRLEQAANRTAPAAFEGLVRMFGIIRDPGTGPTVPVRFNVGDTAGHTIPVGTRLQFTSADGLTVLALTTDAIANIPVGASIGTTTATAATPTAALNGATSGGLVTLDPLSYVDAVVVDGPINGGRDPEDSRAYLSRGANQFTRLTSTLVRAGQFATAAAEDAAVVQAFAVDDFNSDAGSGAPGNHPNHVSVFVAGPAGSALSAPTKAALHAVLSEQALAVLNVHIADFTITDVAVSAQLKRLPNTTDVDVRTAAQAAVTAFLNPDVWPSGRIVYRNELISLLDKVDGVDVPLVLTAPAADVTPTGIGGLVRAGTITITTTL